MYVYFFIVAPCSLIIVRNLMVLCNTVWAWVGSQKFWRCWDRPPVGRTLIHAFPKLATTPSRIRQKMDPSRPAFQGHSRLSEPTRIVGN